MSSLAGATPGIRTVKRQKIWLPIIDRWSAVFGPSDFFSGLILGPVSRCMLVGISRCVFANFHLFNNPFPSHTTRSPASASGRSLSHLEVGGWNRRRHWFILQHPERSIRVRESREISVLCVSEGEESVVALEPPQASFRACRLFTTNLP
jgi:hypothetical protein